MFILSCLRANPSTEGSLIGSQSRKLEGGTEPEGKEAYFFQGSFSGLAQSASLVLPGPPTQAVISHSELSHINHQSRKWTTHFSTDHIVDIFSFEILSCKNIILSCKMTLPCVKFIFSFLACTL